ncbi:MAG: penicillin-binding protein 2, partial [Chloroflexota bacterium]
QMLRPYTFGPAVRQQKTTMVLPQARVLLAPTEVKWSDFRRAREEEMYHRGPRVRPLTVILLAVAIVGLAAVWLGALPSPKSLPAIGVVGTPTPTPLPEHVLAAQAGRRFLDAWERGDYEGMYELLSESSRAAYSKERFVARYRGIAEGVLVTSVKVESGDLRWWGGPAKPIDTQATLPFKVALSSARFGDIVEENDLYVVREPSPGKDGDFQGKDEWRVEWKPELIFRGLTDDTIVRVIPENPVRGAILDRQGRALAVEGTVLSIGLIPGKIKDEDRALSALSDYLGIDRSEIKARYADAQPDWWVPLRDLPMERLEEARKKLADIDGIMLRETPRRVYPEKETAAHILGYVSAVMGEDLEKLASRGYEDGDLVGRAGIEAWAEPSLAGRKGGRAVILDDKGEIQRVIAERSAVAGGQVHLTLDLDLQRKAEQILGDRAGSVVLMDVRDNSVLAMASRPAFNPNSFVLGMSDAEWKRLSEDKRFPFQHRPALSAYPPGSIFKVVTMAAALERGGFKPDSGFHCTGQWTAPGGLKMGCWVLSGHGDVTLADGLVTSCDTVFYEIGQSLDAQDPDLLPEFARQFGLGEATATVGLLEAEGTVPDATWKQKTIGQPWFVGDAINMAIGQGFVEATPLQMANLYSALANGGVRRRPVLVSRVDDGAGGQRYQADEVGRLPVSEATLQTIREAMKRVTADPKGTAFYAFEGFSIPTAGKTGSAENQNPEAHAWFAGYAPADKPEIVVVVMVEGGEHGSEVAAPLGRQMLEAYFGGG